VIRCIDLLIDDHPLKLLLKVKKDAGAVNFAIESEVGKDGSISSKVINKFSYAKFNVDKLTHAPNGTHALETSLKLAPEIKLSFKAAGKGADLGVDYTKGNLYVTSVLDVVNMSAVNSSACIALKGGIKIGGDACVGLKGEGLKGFTVGGSYASGPLFASLSTTNKLSSINVGLLYKVNNVCTIGSQTTHSSDKLCTVHGFGGSYLHPSGLYKFKMTSSGVVHSCFVKKIDGATISAGGSMTANDPSTFKPGITIAI
jgi:voltage-dependent anion channel protein 2